MKVIALAVALVVLSIGRADATVSPEYCALSVPEMARSAYCSVWRSKCGLPPQEESKGDMIVRLNQAQQPRYNYVCRCIQKIGVVLSEDDISFLIEQAQAFDGTLQDFLAQTKDTCERSTAPKPEDESITR